MEWLFIIIVLVVIWFWFKSNGHKAEQSRSDIAAITKIPEIKVTVTTSTARGSRDRSEIAPCDVGDLIAAGDRAWVLNPKSPLPLTLYNADRELAERLKRLLGTAEYWSQKIPDTARAAVATATETLWNDT